MSSVPPTSPPPSPAPPGGGAQPAVTVVSGGDKLARLPVGSVVDATVEAAKARGLALARTALGELTLRLAAAIPDKAQVTLQLLGQAGGKPQMRLLSIDGQPVAQGRAAPAPGTTPAAAATTVQVSSGGQGQPGGSIGAVVVRPAAGVPLAPGTSVQVRVVAVQQPPASAPTGSQQAQAALRPAAPPQGPQGTAQAQSPLPAFMAGRVAPNTQSGQPLVQTPAGLLMLAGAPKLAPGATVTIQVVSNPTAPPPVGAAAVPAAGAALPPPSPAAWPAMQAAVQVLQQAEPRAAEALLRVLPGGGVPLPSPAQIALGLLGFSFAIRAGDGRGFVGQEPLVALQRAGRSDLAARLIDDMAEMSARLNRPAGGEWRTVIVPFANGAAVEPVRLVVRRRPDGEEERAAREEEGERFVVDVTLSNLGRVQLDGLIRQRAKRFDLIVRTERRLPASACEDIGALFREALEEAGLSGQSTFQATPHFFEPGHEELPHGPGVVV